MDNVIYYVTDSLWYNYREIKLVHAKKMMQKSLQSGRLKDRPGSLIYEGERGNTALRFVLSGFLLACLLSVAGFMGSVAINVVRAVEWIGPSAIPPGDNRPFIIWNSEDSGVKQPGASMDIDGMVMVGGEDEALAATENLIYGNIDETSRGNLLLFQNESADVFRIDSLGNFGAKGMSAFGSADTVISAGENLIYGNVDDISDGNLLLLQRESVDIFRIDYLGNMYLTGTVKSDRCFGTQFDSVTVGSYDGNDLGSYDNMNSACPADMHLCTPNEILRTVHCGGALPATGVAWVANGPPGFTSPAANDCSGWATDSSAAYGTFWQFNGAEGGAGFATGCNISMPIACCK